MAAYYIQSNDLKIFREAKEKGAIEMGTVPKVSFFYFRKQCFEILDEEVLEIISKDPSNRFLYEDEEDIYSLDDGEPV